MGQLGDMFPGAKLRKDTPEEAGSGQRFEPGPLDLDGGIVQLRAPRPATPAEDDDRPDEG
jgi:hypothetical protein